MKHPGDTRYSFESKPTRRTLEQAAMMLHQFLMRLGVDVQATESLRADDRRKLIAFTTACHLNIDWYDRHRQRQQRMFWGFVVFTAIVVVGMPMAIFLTYSTANEAFTAQVGVIITGVLSAHRLLASTIEKRNLARHFWKAQADLKSILYSFEDKWRGSALVAGTPAKPAAGVNLSFDVDFMADVEERTQRAIQVKGEEQEQFFARSEGTFSNISEVLGLAYKQGSATYETIQKGARARAGASARVSELEAVTALLAEQLQQLESELETVATATDAVAVARRGDLLKTIDSVRKKQLDKELELTAARSQLSEF